MGPSLQGRWMLAAFFMLCLTQLCAGQGVFLQEQLPLTVLVTTPTTLATYSGAGPVTVTGRQAITAVFSRPVIALGSDWGSKELPSNLVPFNLSCGTPGRLRWVTTNIARFDPAIEWPTDLDCSFNWNKGLKTFDGAPLVLDDLAPSVPLATRPLAVSVVTVSSQAAVDATNNTWSATLGLPDDKLPEVPPDANITLSFSYPVELSKLAAALKVAGPGGAGRTVTVSPCISATPPPLWPIIFTANGPQPRTTTPGNGNSAVDLLKVNSTCAVVKIVPGFEPGAAAVLRLPAGARYSSVAGPVAKDTDVQVYGLRPFRIPLSWDFMNITNISQNVYNGVRYRRLTLWLPHGLAANTKLETLEPLIKICTYVAPFVKDSPCVSQSFELSRPTKGTLVMAVPSLTAKRHYQVTVKGSSGVSDAFGLPLQSSSNTWWTTDYESAYQGPSVNNVALLEASPSNAALSWPWVSRGTPEAGLDKVQGWSLAVPTDGSSNSNMARAIAALNYGYSGVVSNAFGSPDVSISRASSPAPTFQSLALSGKPGVSFVGSCCRDVSWPTNRKVFASNLLVVQSNLQAVFVAQGGKLVAWVTTTQGASKPVVGAKVQVYLSSYGQDYASQGPSCTTSAEGTCSITTVNSSGNSNSWDNSVKSALITAEGEGPLVVPSLPSTYSSVDDKHVGVLVLDRALVKPGDELHVTAYIQKRVGAELQAAKDLPSVILQVTPGFDSSSPGGATRLTVPVDPAYGSAHAVIPVPQNATAASYTLQLYTISKEGSAPAPAPSVPLEQPMDVIMPLAVDAAAMPVAVDGVVPPKLPPPSTETPGDYIASADFTVADPRPPTATLTLTAPAWVKPTASVTVTLTAESYIGSDVSDAAMTLDWDTGKAKGSLELKTNASGVAIGVVELGQLPAGNVSEPGEELSLKATWIGPTREAIIKTKTVKIADGPVRVELQRTLITDVPGMKFGVKAEAFSNEDDSPVKGAAVTVTLVAANGTASLTNCTPVQLTTLSQQKCSIKSGDPRSPVDCQLALPCMGEFELKGCIDGSCGKPTNLGRNASWWEVAPWSTVPQMNLLADRDNVTFNGYVKLSVQNPWWGPTSGLLVWGNAIKQANKTLPQIPSGPSTISISGLGSECRGSCRVVLMLAVARAVPPAATDSFALPDVPTSALFDPLAPRTVSGEVTLKGPQTEALSVAVSVAGQAKTAQGVAVLAPKSGKGTITVTVKDSDGQAVPGAEVTLLVVDKAILDLMPYALQNVSTSIAPDLSTFFSLGDLNALRTSRAAINATFTTLQRRLTKLDPWLPVDTQVTPSNYYPGEYFTPPQAPAVDIPDATYLATHTTAITPLPSRACVWGEACPVFSFSPGVAFDNMAAAEGLAGAAMPMALAAPAPANAPRAAAVTAANASGNMAKTSVAPAASQAAGGAELRIQQEFKTTPMFTVMKSAANGQATATFTAPDNIGQFVVRAYAAAPKPAGTAAPVDVVYGAAESQLIVRRTVSLTPSLPRQVRAGDNFTAGVLVESPGITGDTQVSVTASLVTPSGASSGANPLALNNPSSISVTLSPSKTQQEVRFNFRAKGLGTQNITFAASAAGGGGAVADQVQLEVPVLGKQGPVWIATSFAVRGSNSSSSANRVEGLALPKAENGSGSVSLVAGVGYLPAVQGTYEALVRQGLSAYRECPSGTNAIALSVLPSMLAMYRPANAPAASFLTPNQLDTTLKALSQAATTLTDPTYGLLPVEPRCLYPASSGPQRADIDLNAWATWLVEQLDPAGAGQASKNDSGLASRWGSLDAATKPWRKALEGQLVADAAAARAAQPPREYNDLDSLSWARLVLGSGWIPSGVSNEVQRDLSMERLVAAAVNMSVGAQARIGLTLLDNSSSSSSNGSSNGSSSSKGEVDKIVKRLLSNVRVGGRTAYVATGEGERGAAGLSDQSLALILFMRSGSDNPLVQKIAAWVGQGAAPPPIAYSAVAISSNPWEAALRSRALSFYDDATNSTTPNLGLTVVAATGASGASGTMKPAAAAEPVSLLGARFNASNARSVARSSTKWDKIPAGSSLVFIAKGSGEVSIAASLNFTPAQLLPFPTYRGLWVQRVVQLSSKEGGSLRGVGLGKLVTVAVQVTSPDDQADVVVEVLMPGGLEPLDPNVYPDPDLATICGSSEDESDLAAPAQDGNVGISIRPGMAVSSMAVPKSFVGGAANSGSGRSGGFSLYQPAMWWRPWPVCPVQTTLPAVVTFSFSYFRAGTQTIRFKAIAATSGVFAMPPVKAYVQQQPEVMGLSPAGVFTVCPTAAECPASQQLLEADPAAKPCPSDCSGNGACNLLSGVCICDSGFSGPDCSIFSSTK